MNYNYEFIRLFVVSTRVGGIPEVLPPEFMSLADPIPGGKFLTYLSKVGLSLYYTFSSIRSAIGCNSTPGGWTLDVPARKAPSS